MLTLALIVMLETPAPASLPRIPGTRLRLGMAESQLLATGPFAEVQDAGAGGMSVRRGNGRFFGVPGQATCYLRDGVLAEVRFEAGAVGRHSQEYVDGQLRLQGLSRDCPRDLPGDRVCAWTGPDIRLDTEIAKDQLKVRATRWPPPEPEPAPAVPAQSGAAARGDTAARSAAAIVTLPETLSISLVSNNAPRVWPRIVSSPPLDYPEAARRAAIQGVVWVFALVEPDGRVSDAWMDRGILELDAAALAWVSRCRFAPCQQNGAPCRFHVRVAVRFTLH
jgi:TonB family protein